MVGISRIKNWLSATRRRFGADRRGVVPIVFAMAMLPTLMLTGMAIDFAGARGSKPRLQAAADAAALEAVTLSERLEIDAGNTANFTRGDDSYMPVARAKALFNALVADQADTTGAVTFTVVVQREGPVFRSTLNYAAKYDHSMPNIMGASHTSIEGRAVASMAVSGSGFMEVFTLLDTSSSMGIGASQADIDALKAAYNCAFSCHGEKPNGVKLRIDVMRDAVLDMIAKAKAEKALQPPTEPARIRIAINKFDHEPFAVEPLSSDYDALKVKVQDIKLHPTQHRGTNAKRALEWLTPLVPNSGTGLSNESPRRFVFFVTDGLQDRHPSWYATNFPGPYGANGRTGALDPAACQALKNKGVTVAVLYTKHIGIKGYEWYWQTPQPGVRPALQACASQNFFFEASNAAQLSAEFEKMFKKALEASKPRLEY